MRTKYLTEHLVGPSQLAPAESIAAYSRLPVCVEDTDKITCYVQPCNLLGGRYGAYNCTGVIVEPVETDSNQGALVATALLAEITAAAYSEVLIRYPKIPE